MQCFTSFVPSLELWKSAFKNLILHELDIFLIKSRNYHWVCRIIYGHCFFLNSRSLDKNRFSRQNRYYVHTLTCSILCRRSLEYLDVWKQFTAQYFKRVCVEIFYSWSRVHDNNEPVQLDYVQLIFISTALSWCYICQNKYFLK